MPQKCENFTRASPAVNRRRQYSAETPGTARPVPTRGPRPSHPLLSLLARGGRGADLASPKAAGAGCECIQQGAVACTPTAGEPGSDRGQVHFRVLRTTHALQGWRSCTQSHRGHELSSHTPPSPRRAQGLPPSRVGTRAPQARHPVPPGWTQVGDRASWNSLHSDPGPRNRGGSGCGEGATRHLGRRLGPITSERSPRFPSPRHRQARVPAMLAWDHPSVCAHAGPGGPRPSDSPAQAEAPVRSAANSAGNADAQPHARLSSSSPAQGLGRTRCPQAHH